MRIQTTGHELTDAARSVISNAAFQETLQQLNAGKAPHEMFRAMATYPPVLAAMEAMGEGIYPGGTLPRELKELVILQSSIDNTCQFCTNSHIDIARNLGLGDDPKAIVDDHDGMSPAFRIALTYARAVRTDSNRIPDATFDALREHYSEAQIVELTFLVGYINMLNWFNNALQVEYRGELA